MSEITIPFTQEQFQTAVNAIHEASLLMSRRAIDSDDGNEARAYRNVADERMAEFRRLMRFAPIGPELIDGRPAHVSGPYHVAAEPTEVNLKAWAIQQNYSLPVAAVVEA